MKLVNADGVLLKMNRTGLDLIQADNLDQVRDRSLYPLVSEEHREAFEGLVRDVFQGMTRSMEFKVTGLKGRVSWLHTRAVPMRNSDGEIVFMLAVTDDITVRREAEEKLRQSERQLAESQRIAHIGSWQHNLTTGEVVWSDELFRILGLDPRKDPADFKMFFNMIHPDDRPILKEAIDEAVRTGSHFSVDYRFILRDGRTRILHAQAELIYDETGMQAILSGTGQDITVRKEAEEKLRQSEEFIRSILNTVDEGFIVIGRDYRILSANQAYCSQVGVSGEKIIGRHCYEVSHHNSRPCHEEGEECAVRHVLATGEPHAALHRHKDPQGNILYVETKAYPLRDASGQITSAIETVNNITAKYLLEEERLKTQKLESIGTLAGGIAHDFNNLLQGIFGYISMARMSLNSPERARAMLQQAEAALHLSVNLTTQLLTFSKGGKPAKKLIRLEPVVENAVRFALSGSHTDHQLDIEADLWPAEADEGQLAQVIQNIVLNANEAMAGRGTAVVSVKNADIRRGELPGLPDGGRFVSIAIRDSGTGISAEHLPRIFDPYFTTKQKGSGLGLATSYSIIRNHGGIIDVQSEVGRGSTFILYLPAAQGAAMAGEPAAAPTAAARKGKVLVMDDEDLVRSVAGEMIGALGHEVHCAADGQAAIEMYRHARESGSPFDVLILDLTVRGGMGGEETIRMLREMDPHVAAVVSSGYADNPVTADFRAYGFSAFLNKPYKMAALRDCLNGLITQA